MKTCYKYIRVSTQIQDTQRQHTSIDSYCQANSIKVLSVFEEKESGKSRTRKALTALIKACETIKPDYIVVDELSRLGRTSEVLTTIETLAEKGICLYTVKENLYSLNEDGSENTNAILSFYINAGMYRTELVTSKRRMKGGIVSAAERGQFHGGKNIPYGFKLVMKPVYAGSTKIRSFLEIDEDEKQMIEKIYSKYIGGDGCMKIAIWLNSSQYKTRTGRNWGIPVIYAILKNRLYTGVRVMPTGVEINSYPQIIDNQTFQTVQDILSGRNKQQGIHKKFEYLLDGGLVRCGVCGMNYFGNKTTRGQNNVYCCLSRKRTYTLPVCGNYGVNIQNFENSVQNIILKYLPEQIQDKLDTSAIDNRIIEIKGDLSGYEQQLKAEERRESELLKLSLNGLFSPNLIAEQAKEIKKNQDSLLSAISRFNKDLKYLQEQKENALNLPELIKQLKTTGINKDLLRKLVSEITVSPEKEINLSGDGRDRTVKIVIKFTGKGEISYYLGQRIKNYKLIEIADLTIINNDRTRFDIISDFENIGKSAKTTLLNPFKAVGDKILIPTKIKITKLK